MSTNHLLYIVSRKTLRALTLRQDFDSIRMTCKKISQSSFMCEIYEANETYEHYTYHQTGNVGNSNIHYIYIYI